jgi:hypothetical protein
MVVVLSILCVVLGGATVLLWKMLGEAHTRLAEAEKIAEVLFKCVLEKRTLDGPALDMTVQALEKVFPSQAGKQ